MRERTNRTVSKTVVSQGTVGSNPTPSATVMSTGLALTAGGVVLGTVAALQLTRLMGYLLYKVGPHDPLAFGSAVVVITVASLVACFAPAWRATRTDPLRALRG